MDRRLDVRGRASPESTWPQGGMVSKRLDERNYDVQQLTGYSVSTVSKGQWVRGQVIRSSAVRMRPPFPVFMYDPTFPAGWRNPGQR